jgi:hypothetical protein
VFSKDRSFWERHPGGAGMHPESVSSFASPQSE